MNPVRSLAAMALSSLKRVCAKLYHYYIIAYNLIRWATFRLQKNKKSRGKDELSCAI